MNDEKLLQTIKAVDVPEDYQIIWREGMAIQKSADSVMECIMLAFNYGFLQGQRAAQKEVKQNEQR